MKIIDVRIDQLIPYARNTKAHPKKQVEKIARSIEEFGFNIPIVIDDNNVIIAGHGRLEAAKLLGLKTVPAVRVAGLTDAQIRAFRIADNKVAESEWLMDELEEEISALMEEGFDLELTGFDIDELDRIIADNTESGIEDDEIPEAGAERVEYGDLWALGPHRLLCGDATIEKDVKRLLGGEKIDLVFTDPPYGVNYADREDFDKAIGNKKTKRRPIKNDDLSVSDISELWAATFDAWAPYHKKVSSYYICSPQGGELLMMMMMMMNEHHHPLRHFIVWNKNHHVLGRADYNYKHEPILFGWQHTHKFYGGGRFKTSVWDFPKPQKSELHPTMKPVELIENAILNSSRRGMLVADYFLGSGSTLIACEKTGRACYGMEIEPYYGDVILNRWEAYTGKKAELLERA